MQATSGAGRIGYAVSEHGRGVVYARLSTADGVQTLRALFRTERDEGTRAAGFAAVAAIGPLLRKHVAEIALVVDDAELAADLGERRELPVQLMLAYVRARCALNAFKVFRLSASAAPNDLTARARAEVSMQIAA